MNDDRGPLYCEFPSTISLKNWPFLVFLLFLAGIFVYGGIASDHPREGLFIGLAVLIPAIIVAGVQVVGLIAGTYALAAYENGLLVRQRGGLRLIEWTRFTDVILEREIMNIDGAPVPGGMVVRLRSEGGQFDLRPVGKAAELAVFIGTKAGVKVQAV